MEVKHRKSSEKLVGIKGNFKICEDGRAEWPNKKTRQKQLINLTEAAKKRLEKLGEGGKLRVNALT